MYHAVATALYVRILVYGNHGDLRTRMGFTGISSSNRLFDSWDLTAENVNFPFHAIAVSRFGFSFVL